MLMQKTPLYPHSESHSADQKLEHQGRWWWLLRRGQTAKPTRHREEEDQISSPNPPSSADMFGILQQFKHQWQTLQRNLSLSFRVAPGDCNLTERLAKRRQGKETDYANCPWIPVDR